MTDRRLFIDEQASYELASGALAEPRRHGEIGLDPIRRCLARIDAFWPELSDSEREAERIARREAQKEREYRWYLFQLTYAPAKWPFP